MKPNALIHVVDDDESLRDALLDLLAAAGFEARGYASTGDFLLQPVPDRAGCVLLDVRMPGPSGLDLQAAMQRQGLGLPIVFLTGRGDIATTVQAMKRGATDFLTKPVDDTELLAAIQEALATDQQRRRTQAQRERMVASLAALTERERQVLEQVVAGRLNKQIAAELGTVEKTIKFHRANLMRKMGVRSVADLVKLAERAGIGAASGS